MSDVLIVLGHPSVESFCGDIASAYADGIREHDGVSARVLTLATLHFDPILRGGHTIAHTLEPDLREAQQAIASAKHVVWVYPMWWVSEPALLKGFIDRAFLPGWAFRYDEGRAMPTKLLGGRSARIIMTMDSPGWWYRLNYRFAATHSFKRGTLLFSGFSPVKTTHVYNVRTYTSAQRQAQLDRVRRIARKDVRRIA